MDEKAFRSRKQKFIREFIELYKSFPCLWKVKSSEYHMRHRRTNAYKVLVNKLKEIDADADRAAVVRKINSLRSNMRKEKRRIQEMAKLNKKYKPKLWYYQDFNFLEGQDRNNLPAIEDSKDSTTYIVMKTETDEEGDDPLQTTGKSQDKESEVSIAEDNPPNINSFPRIGDVYSENVESPAKTLRREDHFDVFGKNVAAKLREIFVNDNDQRLMAEKIINDALFLAQMKHLTFSHCNKLNLD